jgi:hydrogenase maturation protein HypF
MSDKLKVEIKIHGIVQGVGFRPAAVRLAEIAGVTGTVSNSGSCVNIIAEGTRESIDKFQNLLSNNAPDRALVMKTEVSEINDGRHFCSFSIIESTESINEIYVSPDIAVCPDCIRELKDKNNRRYHHPFINCTSCGPRLTILDKIPYDRVRTSMSKFEMCSACRHEYNDPEDRRYDAQPVCCNSCGPYYYVLNSDGTHGRKDSEAIRAARNVIEEGGIAAVKGIGGFHLICDASNDDAVKLLRERKARPGKPFAVMMRDIDAVKKRCHVSSEEERILTGPEKPIILLKLKKNTDISQFVAPDNPYIGVMLPYAPIQILLFDFDDDIKISDTLIMTSANMSGAPICIDDAEAASLYKFSDIVLSHNRDIKIRCDDSLMDMAGGKPYMIRRSRGYSPLPVILSDKDAVNKRVLAAGGELKNTFCIANESNYYLSPYVGDLSDLRCAKTLKSSIKHFFKLFQFVPDTIVTDLHPRYNSSLAAFEVADELKKHGKNVNVLKVQHHFAHIVSCMAENDYSSPVIGIAFDGTGIGPDNTIWGGEILLADYRGYRRIGSISPFQHIGGDSASKEGWRIAASLICDLYGELEYSSPEKLMLDLRLCSETEAKVIHAMHRNHINSVMSTSAGRIFDAVSAILGIRRKSGFEGEAAQQLTFHAEKFMDKDLKYSHMIFNECFAAAPHDIPDRLVSPGKSFYTIDVKKIIKDIIIGRLEGEETDRMAFMFHIKLAEETVKAVRSLKEQDPALPDTAALSGGCFQNKIFLNLVRQGLENNGMRVLLHSLVPPNDGGISLGQAVIGMHAVEPKGFEPSTSALRTLRSPS